jgi:Right handed beta helix region
MKRFSPDIGSTFTCRARHSRVRSMLFIGLIAFGGGFTKAANAALIVVDAWWTNTDNDDDTCVLVEAVTAINNNAAYHGCEGGNGYDGIKLPNGTINSGSIWLSRPATIQGNGLTASAINFTSSGTGCGLTASDGLTLTNLTLQQGPGISITGLCGAGGSVTLNGVRVRWFQNSGMAMFGGSLSGNNIRVENNHSFGDGGGIWVDAGASMGTITGISITNNTTPDSRGGGLAYFGVQNPALHNCTISGNHAYQGGGIFSNGQYLDVSHCTIASNTATEGGGIYSLPFQSGYIRISQSTIVSNSANSGANFYGPPGLQTANSTCNLWGGPFDQYQAGIQHSGDDNVANAIIVGSSTWAESNGLSNTGTPYFLAMYPLKSTARSRNKCPSGSPTDIRGASRPLGTGTTPFDRGSLERD